MGVDHECGILIAGVGGQGTLLASRVIGNVAIKRGLDVKVSEVHGMSQRGGAVVTYVRFSNSRVHSPILDQGRADIIMAFEQMEAYRNISCVKSGGVVIMNTQRINPMPVISGTAEYPGSIADKILRISGDEHDVSLYTVDAMDMAKAAGSVKAVNMVLTGMLARLIDKEGRDKNDWLDTIRDSVRPEYVQANLDAFEAGFACMCTYG